MSSVSRSRKTAGPFGWQPAPQIERNEQAAITAILDTMRDPHPAFREALAQVFARVGLIRAIVFSGEQSSDLFDLLLDDICAAIDKAGWVCAREHFAGDPVWGSEGNSIVPRSTH